MALDWRSWAVLLCGQVDAHIDWDICLYVSGYREVVRRSKRRKAASLYVRTSTYLSKLLTYKKLPFMLAYLKIFYCAGPDIPTDQPGTSRLSRGAHPM